MPIKRSKKSAPAKKSRTEKTKLRAPRSKRQEKSSTDAAPWMKRGKAAREATRGGLGSFTPLVPEFFLGDGESQIVKIITPIDQIERSVGRHSYPAVSKRGKRYFRSFTCVQSAEKCAGCANGDRASMRWVVEVIDPRPATVRVYDPETKQSNEVEKKCLMKLFMPSVNEIERFFSAVDDYEEDNGPVEGVIEVKIKRTGSKSQTAYDYRIKRVGCGLKPSEKQAIEDFHAQFGEVEQALAPIPLKEQQSIVGTEIRDAEDEYSSDAEDEEEEDPPF